MTAIQQLQVGFQLGKNGTNENSISEIKLRLKKNKILKIRFLKSYPFKQDRIKEADNIAKLTLSKVVTIRGNVFVLSK